MHAKGILTFTLTVHTHANEKRVIVRQMWEHAGFGMQR